MKKAIKLVALAVLIITYSCSNDDNVSINLSDLVVSIDENPNAGQVVGIILNDGTSTLTYSIATQSPAGALAINTSTGELTVANAALFDFETNPTITATVAATGAANTASVIVNVGNISELTIQNFTTTMDENPTQGQSIGTIQASSDSTISYSITSQTPAGAMNINASTGLLTVSNLNLFNFEVNPVITANISVNNSGRMQTLIATVNLSNVNEIGDFNHGGVVFWLDGNGGGLVCNISDLNAGSAVQWGNNGIEYQATGATATAIGTGQANTTTIISVQGAGTYAASLCDNLTLNGYSDWYLPSKDELNQMFVTQPTINAVATANGGTAFTVFYWSSTQATSNTNVAWVQFFQGGGQSINNKLNQTYVRAVRTF